MSPWYSRLAVGLISVLAASWAGGTILGSASAESHVSELGATCLACGEQWGYAPPAGFGSGLLSLIRRRRKSIDRCPKCGSTAVVFGHRNGDSSVHHGRTS